jgi:hypothetical protein
LLTIPIGIVWLSAEKILEKIVPEKRSAELAGLYLRILLIGAPGYACFESGKRFVQAQGLFSATTYVLLIAAPLNAFMNWFFVWYCGFGFAGAPAAVVITDNLLPVFLFGYVYFVDGKQCWNGFTKKAFKNWGMPLSPPSPTSLEVVPALLVLCRMMVSLEQNPRTSDKIVVNGRATFTSIIANFCRADGQTCSSWPVDG